MGVFGVAVLTDRLHLDCTLGAAKQARDWLARELADWSDGSLDDAVLVVSELVTNAVLHAQTEVEVVAHVATGTARVEVIDRSPARPMPRHYGVESTTGRGLLLLDTLTARWGTEVSAHAKSVWFEMGTVAAGRDAAPSEDDVGLPDLSAWPDLEDFDAETPPAAASPPLPTVEVRILDLPLAVYLAAQEHNDALMREFVLLAEYAPPGEVPRRLVELAGEVRRQFGPASTTLADQIEAAVQHGDRTVDLAVTIPTVASQSLLRLSEQLDEADRYCESGDLLTLSSPPIVRHFRAWYTRQISTQLDGAQPVPWPHAAIR